MVPLVFANTMSSYKILKTGGSPACKHRLESLGFIPGEDVQIISGFNGDVIVNIKNSRLALNKDQARHIFLEELEK